MNTKGKSKMKFDSEKYRIIGQANQYAGMDKNLKRLEIAIHKVTGEQVFVLDRKEIISDEDGFALSFGREKLKSLTNLRRN